MTVTVNSRRREYEGNGVAQIFNGPMAYSQQDIQVYLISTDGAVLLPSTDYRIDRFGRESGTRVNMNVPPAIGETLLLLRTVPFSQEVDITNQSAFHAETIEKGFDALAMQNQQLNDSVQRSFRLSDTYTGALPDLSMPSPVGGSLIGWNPAGTGLRNVDPSGPADLQLRSDLNDPSAGASLVRYRLNSSSVSRPLDEKLSDVVSVKDFGAVGDGIADDTEYFRSAIAYIKNTGATLHVPAGTYRIASTLAAGRIYPNQQLRIIGDGPDLTKLQATASLTGPVLEVGSEIVSGYSGSVWLQDFAIRGAGIGVTSRGLQLWGVVHADFTRLFAYDCDIGFENRGGIDVDFEACFAYRNAVGFNVDRWVIGSDTSWPNITNLLRCEIKDNTQWGVRFDNGRMLNITDSDIETNGTVSDLGTGGIYVGPGINNETPGVDGQGLVIERTWLEANAGLSTLVFESGVNTIKSCTIVANAGAVNDVLVKGGNYHILHSHIAPFKTANVLEELTAAVKAGNSIVDTYGGIYSFDIAKTQRQVAPFVARAANLPNMTLQMGRVTGGAGQVVVIFPTPFAPGSTVEVFTQIRNLSSATLDEVEVHSGSPTQFTLERKSVAIPPGTSISTAGTYTVSWLAIGQAQ